MSKINLAELNIEKAHELLQNGDLSARELLEFYGTNIKKQDKDLNVYLEVFDDAYERAEEIDKEFKSGKELPILAGIPIAIKDNILIRGKKCSAGSKMLEDFVAPYSATVVDKLEKEGSVFVGRTNMDEFAMGSSTENSAFGPTKNPYDKERVPGGSSGGSAVAVASQMCLCALGSDTGGSVRQPASFCNVVGLKPTYGCVSRNGLMAVSSSLDQIGPITKTIGDAEIIFNAIKGVDPMDATTVSNYRSSTSTENLSKSNSSTLKVGVPREFFDLDGDNSDIDEEVATAIQGVIDFYKSKDFEIKQIDIPSLKYAMEVYYVIQPAEVSSNMARYDGVRYGFFKKGENLLGDYINTREHGFGREVRRRILLGTYVLSAGYHEAYYNKAQRVKNLMISDLKKTFSEVDVILGPTSPSLPFKIGEKTEDSVKMYLADVFTCPVNLTGVPAISIPCGFSKDKLPIGFQLITSWFKENKLFELGKVFEEK
ncbi:MAG: Asp-tRNA(Asn)/Glu-tRNA(Gln) amidotransferase subunit GatA [Patescibacteria group bacterium]